MKTRYAIGYGLTIAFFWLLITGALAETPSLIDVNMASVDGYDTSKPMPSFSYAEDGNLTIDFNITTDLNYTANKADMNYSTTNSQGTGTNIVSGLLIDGNRCQTNFTGTWNNTAGSDSSLVGYWKFDAQEDVNTSRAFDYSGNGNHGQYISNADNNAQGKWDTNAAWFDGINDYIEISATQDMNDLNESFTLSTWFNANGSQNKGAEVLSRTGFFWIGYNYDGDLEFALRDENTDQDYNGMDNVYHIKRVTTTTENNQWNQITASSDGTNINLYLNGTLQASGTVKQTLNPYCIDKYEASHSDATFCDNASAWTGTCENNYGSSPIPASQPNVIPWTTISQINAATACAAAGKHLCSSEEWMAAANLNGQVYDLSNATTDAACVVDNTNYCSNHSQSSGEACNTGSNNSTSPSNCKSSEGVYDLIGNVWEWTSDEVDVNADSIDGGWNFPNDDVSPNLWGNTTKSAHYGNDGVYTSSTKLGRAVLRGGPWSYGSYAGLFCVFLSPAPGTTGSNIGFRCCSEPETYNACDTNMAFINPSIKIGYDTNAFNGRIEETKLYRRALTATEILSDYDLGIRNFRTCSYDWNISGIADANYYTNILAYDDAENLDFSASANSFRVNPVTPPPTSTCTPPASGCWEIDNGDECTIDDTNSLAGGICIQDGTLTITSTGTVNIPSGNSISIKDLAGNWIYIEDGGKIVIQD